MPVYVRKLTENITVSCARRSLSLGKHWCLTSPGVCINRNAQRYQLVKTVGVKLVFWTIFLDSIIVVSDEGWYHEVPGRDNPVRNV